MAWSTLRGFSRSAELKAAGRDTDRHVVLIADEGRPSQ
jgi:hypothetical protein